MVLASHTVTSSSSRSPFLISITPSSLGLCAVARGSWTGEEEKVEALLLTGSSNELQAGTKGNKSQGTEVPTQLLQLRCKKSHKKQFISPPPLPRFLAGQLDDGPTFILHLTFYSFPPLPLWWNENGRSLVSWITRRRRSHATSSTFFSHFAESAFRDASIQDRAAALSFSFPF